MKEKPADDRDDERSSGMAAQYHRTFWARVSQYLLQGILHVNRHCDMSSDSSIYLHGFGLTYEYVHHGYALGNCCHDTLLSCDSQST